MGAIHIIHKRQHLPISIEEAWDFLSSPQNLKVITPDYMGFNIKNEEDLDKMYPGQIIHYTVSPMFGIPLKWVTEITHVKDYEYFVDEQRFGPYSLWHHKHFLRRAKNGVVMEDLIHYKLPFGFLGNIMQKLVVRKQLEEIFEYRVKKLEEIFGKKEKVVEA